MVELRTITEENFEECLELELTQSQKQFVASNAYSLSEAYALSNGAESKAMPYAIYADGVMVGFIMAVYQPMEEEDPTDEDIYYLARMMVDTKHQGKGYGRKALEALLAILKTFPYGNAEAVVLSCSRDNAIAFRFYQSFGFVEIGEDDEDGDALCRLPLL